MIPNPCSNGPTTYRVVFAQLTAVCLVLAGCGGESQSSIKADPAASFERFVERLFKQLSATPISDA